MQLGGEAVVVGEPCFTEQQNILSDGGRTESGTRCTQSAVWNISVCQEAGINKQ